MSTNPKNALEALLIGAMLCSIADAAEDAADIAKAHAAVDTMLDAMFAAQPQEAAPVAQGDAEDAARYRWLRSGVRERQGIPVSGHRTISSGALRALMEFNFWCTPGELDTAIDAARSKATEGSAA